MYTPYIDLITDDLGKTCNMYVVSTPVNILCILACVYMHTDICIVNMSLSYLGVCGFEKTYVSFQRFCFELDQSYRVFFFFPWQSTNSGSAAGTHSRNVKLIW